MERRFTSNIEETICEGFADAGLRTDVAARAIILIFWKGEGYVDSAGRRFEIFAAAGGDHYKLAAVDGIGGGSGVARKRQSGFPQKSSLQTIVSAKFFVVVGSADEE